MAKKRKAGNPWDEIFSRVRVSKNWKWVYPPRPSAADLDEAQRLLGCPLPASYRAFVDRFGLRGELAGWFRPDPLTGKPDDFFTVVGRTRWWREQFAGNPEDARAVGEDFAAHLVAIGSTGGGDSFAFHTAEVTDRKRSEYRVYELGRHGQWREAHGDTFAEFIDQIARTVRGWRLEDGPDGAGPEGEIEYSPGARRYRLPFTKKAVVGWLAANDGVARQLCAAIRTQGKWENLPILADALADAGCGDQDLLQACRSGNPQADGEWVLGVLENLGRKK